MKPDFAAGHSLGEYTAAVVAGALSPEDGIKLVSARGALMAAAQDELPGGMAAVLGLEADKVAALCDSIDGRVTPANFNTPSQIVVSGDLDAIDKLVEAAPEAGASRAIKLQVGAAFHSEAMVPVQAKMAERMADVEFRDPTIPIVSNASRRGRHDRGRHPRGAAGPDRLAGALGRLREHAGRRRRGHLPRARPGQGADRAGPADPRRHGHHRRGLAEEGREVRRALARG